MKAIKLFLLAFFSSLSLAAQIQLVELYKDGHLIDTYTGVELDSIVYKTINELPKYYFYAGWECPKSIEELEDFALNKTYPSDIDSQIMNRAGGEITHFKTFSYDYSTKPLFDQKCWDDYDVTGVSERQYYVVLPTKSAVEYLQIYALGMVISQENGVTFNRYKDVDLGENYIIYRSVNPSLYINAITIKL